MQRNPRINEFHEYNKRIARLLERIAKEENFSKTNIKAVDDFLLRMVKNSPATIAKNLDVLIDFFGFVKKDYTKITKEDVKKYYNHLVTRKRIVKTRTTKYLSDEKLAPATVQKYLVVIKKFFRVMFDLKKGHYPECVDWIEPMGKTRNYITPEMLPTQEQVMQAINCALNPRDAALVAMLNDCGMRAGELASLNINNIREEKNYFVISLRESKSVPRTIISYLAKPYIKRWLAKHPKLDGANSPLFVQLGTHNPRNRIKYSALRKAVKTAFKRAGIELNVHPHLFRHCFNTRSAKFYTYAQRDYWNGWQQSSMSEMSSIYTHFNYEDIIPAYFKMIREERNGSETVGNPMLLIECGNCGTENPNADFCTDCGADIKLDTMLNQDNNLFVKAVSGLTTLKKNKVEWKSDRAKNAMYEMLDEYFKSKGVKSIEA